jgi:hypothetical protein
LEEKILVAPKDGETKTILEFTGKGLHLPLQVHDDGDYDDTF